MQATWIDQWSRVLPLAFKLVNQPVRPPALTRVANVTGKSGKPI